MTCLQQVVGNGVTANVGGIGDQAGIGGKAAYLVGIVKVNTTTNLSPGIEEQRENLLKIHECRGEERSGSYWGLGQANEKTWPLP